MKTLGVRREFGRQMTSTRVAAGRRGVLTPIGPWPSDGWVAGGWLAMWQAGSNADSP